MVAGNAGPLAFCWFSLRARTIARAHSNLMPLATSSLQNQGLNTNVNQVLERAVGLICKSRRLSRVWKETYAEAITSACYVQGSRWREEEGREVHARRKLTNFVETVKPATFTTVLQHCSTELNGTCVVSYKTFFLDQLPSWYWITEVAMTEPYATPFNWMARKVNCCISAV